MSDNLFAKFQRYLDKELKTLPNTKEGADFKAELLDSLMCRAYDLQEKGLPNDEIYLTCINSLGDYSDTLRALSRNPLAILKDNRFWLNILYAVTYSLLMVILYVAVSFVTGDWGLPAMIIFPILFMSLYIALSIIVIKRNIALKKHITTGIIIFSLMAFVIIGLYFILSFAVDSGWASPGRAWSLFVFIMPLAILAEIINKVFFRKNKKINAFMLAALVLTSSIALYLLIATIIWSFHPYWLIILLGIAISILILIVSINKKLKGKNK